jgi:hypothetical protein
MEATQPFLFSLRFRIIGFWLFHDNRVVADKVTILKGIANSLQCRAQRGKISDLGVKFAAVKSSILTDMFEVSPP